MRVAARRIIAAPVERVWEVLSDPTAYPRLVPGLATVAAAGERRYAYQLRWGGVSHEGAVEVTDATAGTELVLTGVDGPLVRARWSLRAVGEGRTEVHLDLTCQPRGRGWADAATGVVLRRQARRALDSLAARWREPSTSSASALRDQASTQALALVTLARCRVVAPMRPDRLLGVARGFLRWGLTPPGGYAIGAARHPDRPAVVDEQGAVTFAELDDRTTRLANGLLGSGVKAGDRVAVLCRNHRGFVETVVACAKIGAHVVLVNTGLSATQTAAVLRDQGASVVVADAEFRPMLARAPRGVRRIIALAEGSTRSLTLEGLVAESPAAALPRPPRSRMIVLTSGTTGTPKGARRPEPPSLAPAAAVLSRIPLRAGEPMLVSAPLFHTWGLAAFQLALVLGSTLVLHRRFDPVAALRAIHEHRCTSWFVVPVMLQRLLETPEADRGAWSTASLSVVASSGSALPGPLAVRFQREYGRVLYNLYGSTEVSWASIATPDELMAAPGTAGRPPRGTRLAVLDPDGAPVPPGRPGRIFVANEMLFDGYTNGAGKEVRAGMMATGDVGQLDEAGLLFVVGRDDEMVVSGGENVYPREVEDLLAGLAGVREAAVVGVPDEEYGQRLAAYVVPAEGVDLTADAVREHVRANLARFSVPRDVVFLDALPRNSTGKVLKRELPRP
ncbi:AMP-binding protein [Streptoalloteichus hindustanus]|uniref:Fatty-acyl-CoA synthase n=1 Tax=Streptoalloteichus hindustanus TaxID=2017 RepID=A0A1M5Q7X1_STRHI|nr:AMP-binding protein [Streptoalloteichus hindustanus]SHH10088.1 fatty-acyl-CoA synthase [Streptoalloteichus hindustanus]